MVPSDADNDCATIAGDGDYAVEVVSESRHQERLEWLGQGRGEEPVDYTCTALLAYEPDNPHVADAVSVSINGVRVGYLPPDAAASMIAAMQTWGFDRATCDAIIEGGWYRSADDKGDFCVRLDVNPDFVPATLPIAHPPPPPVPIAATTRPRNTVYDLVIGATATVAMLVVVGVVWLFAQQSIRSATERHALVPVPQEPAATERRTTEVASARGLHETATRPSDGGLEEINPANATPSAKQRDVTLVTTGSDRSSPVSTSSEVNAPDVRVAAAEAVTNIPTARPPQPTKVALPATRDVPSDTPVHVPSVDAATAPQIPSPAGVRVARHPSVAAVAPPAAQETRPALERGPTITGAAQAVAEELDPSAATAMSPQGLRAEPRLAARSSLPPKPVDGTEWAKVVPQPRPEMDTDDSVEAAESADTKAQADAKAKAQAEARRARARARSRAASRAARARNRARNGTRHSRRGRRAVQYRRTAAPAAARRAAPAPVAQTPVVARAARPPVPPATRLFEAWTKDVKDAMDKHKHRLQPQ